MDIVYATDKNYAFLTGISIISLFENNKGELINVYVIEDGIAGEDKENIMQIGEKYKQNISMIKQPDLRKLAGGIKIEASNWSLTAFVKLFLADLLPKHIKRLIWLDCDTIVTDSISRLWNTDLETCTGGVLDASSYFKRKQGFTENDYYFNTGVLLIDLDAWREQKIEQQMVKTLVDMKGVSVDVDQGIINKTLKGKISMLPERYNVISLDYIWGIKHMDIRNRWNSNQEFYSYEERKESLQNPAILHFVGGDMGCMRPWFKKCIHPKKYEFIKYKDLSPWKDVPLMTKHTDIKTRILFWISIFFPRFHRFYVTMRKHKCESVK